MLYRCDSLHCYTRSHPNLKHPLKAENHSSWLHFKQGYGENRSNYDESLYSFHTEHWANTAVSSVVDWEILVTGWLLSSGCQNSWALAGKSTEFRNQNIALSMTQHLLLKLRNFQKSCRSRQKGQPLVMVPSPLSSFIYISIDLILSIIYSLSVM